MQCRWVQSFIASSQIIVAAVFTSAVAHAQTPPSVEQPSTPAGAAAPAAEPPAAPTAEPLATDTAAPPATAAEAPGAAPAPAKPPPAPPYSLPWQLRPAVVANVFRSDTAIALRKDAATGNMSGTIVPTFLGSYKLTPEIAPFVRLGFVHNAPPGEAESGTSFINPVVGGAYAIKPSKDTRLAFTLAFAIPVGTGGGNEPDKATAAANAAGVLARSAFDNAMFAVNDFTALGGVDLAYVDSGFTVQFEATLFQLFRVRGDEVQKDAKRTNFTSGLHIGYFFVPQLSIGTEARAQTFLSTPAAVEADGNLRHTFTLAIGPRFHFKLGESTWIRPGVSVSRGLDKPMTTQNVTVFQLDIPVAF